MTDNTNNKKCIGLGSFFAFLACLSLLLLSSVPARAETPATAVLYPDIREPFKSVFLSIIKGISDSLNGQIVERALTDADSTTDIRNWAGQKDLKVIITLGNQAYGMVPELSKSAQMVVGGIHMTPELQHGGYYGIALSPDPVMLLQRLKTLAPRVRRVSVVYHRTQDFWLIDKAMKSIQVLGLTLNPVPVESLQEAANKYRDLLNNQESDSDALWLPQDSAVLDEQVVLPMILKEAWDRRLIVFSSNPSFVKKGVLFALYPDNYNMGRDLGNMARKLLEAPESRDNASTRNIEFLRDLLIAFNVRTASHLDINLSRDELDSFDLVFPAR